MKLTLTLFPGLAQVQTYPSWQAVTRHSSRKISSVRRSCAIFFMTSGSIRGTSFRRGHCWLPSRTWSAEEAAPTEAPAEDPAPPLPFMPAAPAAAEAPAPADPLAADADLSLEPLLGREKFLLCSFFSPPPKLSAAKREVNELLLVPPVALLEPEAAPAEFSLAAPAAAVEEEEAAPEAEAEAPLSRQSRLLEMAAS